MGKKLAAVIVVFPEKATIEANLIFPPRSRAGLLSFRGKRE
jgi:hypothetical protein